MSTTSYQQLTGGTCRLIDICSVCVCNCLRCLFLRKCRFNLIWKNVLVRIHRFKAVWNGLGKSLYTVCRFLILAKDTESSAEPIKQQLTFATLYKQANRSSHSPTLWTVASLLALWKVWRQLDFRHLRNANSNHNNMQPFIALLYQTC